MKSSDFVIEYAKVFINLASLILGLSLTFANLIIGSGTGALSIYGLMGAWACWIVSIVFGAQVIRFVINLTIRHEDPDDDTADDFPTPLQDTLYSKRLKFQLQAQALFFALGFLVVIVLAVGPLLHWF